jgi:hypothetical protein
MLTEKDKAWLEKRKPPTQKPWATTADDNFCRACKKYNIDCVPWFRNTVDCPTDQGGHYRDAAEFEARVAAKLANYDYTDPCLGKRHCPYAGKGWTCSRCNLKQARLAVEAEMEKENE